jgi:hypothetical protein
MDNLKTTHYSGILGEGAATPAKGGWVSQNWASAGHLSSDQGGAPEPKLAPQNPKGTANRPTPVWPFGLGSGTDPWASLGGRNGDSPGDNDADETTSRAPKRGGAPSRGGNDNDSAEEQQGGTGSDDEKKRMPFNVGKWTSQSTNSRSIAKMTVYRRQQQGNIQAEQVNSTSQSTEKAASVSARVVASWKAPIVPTVGRRTTAQEILEAGMTPTRRYGLPRKFWTGSKREAPPPQLAPSNNHEGDYLDPEVTASPVQQQGVVMTEAEEIKAAAAGKSCCGNALWFD